MKSRIGLILLLLVSLGLGVALIITTRNAKEQQVSNTDTILSLSNNLVATTTKLEDQIKVNTMLESDMARDKKNSQEAYAQLTNSFTLLSGNLTKTEAALKGSQEEVAKRDQKIKDLELQNQDLDKQAADLSSAITNLSIQIAETQKRLATSEGEKAFLDKELKRMIAEKADLERQFNDLKILRAQVAKLKEELSIARRVEWIRQGLFAASDDKGASRLMRSTRPVDRPQGTNYDLNVEVSSDGSVRVVPPLTNRPPAAR